MLMRMLSATCVGVWPEFGGAKRLHAKKPLVWLPTRGGACVSLAWECRVNNDNNNNKQQVRFADAASSDPPVLFAADHALRGIFT